MNLFEKHLQKQLKGLGLSMLQIKEVLKKYPDECPVCQDYEWCESFELVINHLEAYPDTCLKKFKQKKELGK